DDLARADFGDGLAVDHRHAQACERGPHGPLHASAFEVAASPSADHGHLSVGPGGLNLTRYLDPGLGPADRDDTHRPASVAAQSLAQSRRGPRAFAGLEPVGMFGYARNLVHVNAGTQRANRLLELDLPFSRTGGDPDASPVRIKRRHVAANEI